MTVHILYIGKAGFDTGFFARGGGKPLLLLIAYSGFSIVYIFFVGREEGYRPV